MFTVFTAIDCSLITVWSFQIYVDIVLPKEQKKWIKQGWKSSSKRMSLTHRRNTQHHTEIIVWVLLFLDPLYLTQRVIGVSFLVSCLDLSLTANLLHGIIKIIRRTNQPEESLRIIHSIAAELAFHIAWRFFHVCNCSWEVLKNLQQRFGCFSVIFSVIFFRTLTRQLYLFRTFAEWVEGIYRHATETERRVLQPSFQELLCWLNLGIAAQQPPLPFWQGLRVWQAKPPSRQKEKMLQMYAPFVDVDHATSWIQ